MDVKDRKYIVDNFFELYDDLLHFNSSGKKSISSVNHEEEHMIVDITHKPGERLRKAKDRYKTMIDDDIAVPETDFFAFTAQDRKKKFIAKRQPELKEIEECHWPEAWDIVDNCLSNGYVPDIREDNFGLVEDEERVVYHDLMDKWSTRLVDEDPANSIVGKISNRNSATVSTALEKAFINQSSNTYFRTNFQKYIRKRFNEEYRSSKVNPLKTAKSIF